MNTTGGGGGGGGGGSHVLATFDVVVKQKAIESGVWQSVHLSHIPFASHPCLGEEKEEEEEEEEQQQQEAGCEGYK
ncbi:hypothetical protein E2C01_031386 [Portunus trituberculatus]|uniref:Uncharacterized protein n=1 Tax=Portunus trituberculatus TaxID=210409 RepID=A0A5B7ETA6_PORTR|nr:hypothetical protein [Portunus trituberculatus]